MAEARLHKGGCHCGKVRYEVTVATDPVVSCNCSICLKRGLLLAFAGPDDFKLVSGADELQDYQFYKHNIHHAFCKTCGVESFARGKSPGSGKEMIAVNVRCLDDIDISTLNLKPIDGRKF